MIQFPSVLNGFPLHLFGSLATLAVWAPRGGSAGIADGVGKHAWFRLGPFDYAQGSVQLVKGACGTSGPPTVVPLEGGGGGGGGV